MATMTIRRTLIGAGLLGLAALARAAPVELLLMVVPPFTLDEAQRKGAAGDLVLEAMRRAGLEPQLKVMPSSRAVTVAADPAARDLLIIPLARQPARETHYTWIAPIIKVERAFFTRGPVYASFADARRGLRMVGVARNTAGVNILHAQGFKPDQIYELADGISGALMLANGRIDAWFGPVAQFRSWQREADPSHKLVAGPLMGGTTNYLACSRQCSPFLVQKLRRELDAMQRDGAAHAIFKRYDIDD